MSLPSQVRHERVYVVDDPEALQALAHPLRVQVLEALREAGSAAAVARAVGHSRQAVNYHLKELERVGLVHRIGERRTGNFIEALYQAVASTLVVSPQVAWRDPRRLEALRRQHSLERLVLVGERLQRDAAALLDRAAFDGEEIASATVEAEVHFADESQRAEFLAAYFDALRELCDRYGAATGDPYRVVVAAHPAAGEMTTETKENS
jgi:DNA-binding transcriptional ArsR family regulator